MTKEIKLFGAGGYKGINISFFPYTYIEVKKNSDKFKKDYLDALNNSTHQIWVDFRINKTKEDIDKIYQDFCNYIDNFLHDYNI